VSEPLPSVTVIIPTRPDLSEILAVSAARRLDYPADRLQILVARGKQPSIQRNTALKAARGEIIYFLDDDSVPAPENLRLAIPHFSNPSVQIVGGPNLCPPSAPFLEKVFALVLASWLAFGPSRARYLPVGGLRAAGEKELILCNLIARRQPLLELGGFNELLYPNEENALMDELQKRGGKLLYDPQFMVLRRPRRTLKSFAKMLFTYGRGRAEQFRVHPTPGSALNFVPPLFCIYLVALMVLLPWLGSVAGAPLELYALAVVGQTLVLLPLGGLKKSLAALPFIVLTHVLYGLGFWRGLFTKLKTDDDRPKTTVTLDEVTISKNA
jgi:glycosyltransferase involved in cell wall biosynthesis